MHAPRFSRFVRLLAFTACLALVWRASAVHLGPVQPEVGGLVDLPMYADPAVGPVTAVPTMDPRLDPLWRAALKRPDAQTRLLAAEAFGRAAEEAAESGYRPSAEAIALLSDLAVNDPAPAVRNAAVDALAAVGQADAELVAALIDEAADSVDAARVAVIDAALVAWGVDDAYAAWGSRLSDRALPFAVRRSAINALAESAPASRGQAGVLADLALSAKAPPSLRLEAAAAVRQMPWDGEAARLESLAAGDAVERQVAATLLPPLGDDGTSLALQLVKDPQPTVAAAAVAALAPLDDDALLPPLTLAAQHEDESVRFEAAKLMSEKQGPRIIALLEPMLADSSVRVRHKARENLHGLYEAAAADSPARRQIEEVVQQALQPQPWRAAEQAAYLAGHFDMEFVAEELVALLAHERPEVRLASAQALRQVAVPSTLPAMLAHAERLTEISKSASFDDAYTYVTVGQQATQLFMAFGHMRYAEAEPLLKQYVAKQPIYAINARTAAIYGLGYILEGNVDAALASQLVQRMNDLNPLNPEADDVRYMSGITLGRMNAESKLGDLREFATGIEAANQVGDAARWAIEQISGEAIPRPEASKRTYGGWFLAPID